jgi:hypothetical protein
MALVTRGACPGTHDSGSWTGLAAAQRLDRQLNRKHGPPTLRTINPQRAATRPHSIGKATQARPAIEPRAAAAIVANLDHQASVATLQVYLDRRCTAVPEGIGQSLRDGKIRRHASRRWDLLPRAAP